MQTKCALKHFAAKKLKLSNKGKIFYQKLEQDDAAQTYKMVMKSSREFNFSQILLCD